MSDGLPTIYQQYIHKSRYARWLPDEKRREHWPETIARYLDFWVKRGFLTHGGHEYTSLFDAIYNLKVMPSMRALMTAGPALERDQMSGFNCAAVALGAEGKDLELSHPELERPIKVHLGIPIEFDEVFYALLCGSGMGFSVERQFICNLPKVGSPLNRGIYAPTQANFPGVDEQELSFIDTNTNTIVVHDSKYGWASALRILIVELYNGNFDVKWDVSLVRPAGAPLKTFGGRASGPGPLVNVFEFTVNLFKNAEGRRLTSVECHSLVCKIAEAVIVGGVRRSALISLSNLSDDRMRHAKTGNWWEQNPHYSLANNSVAYTERPEVGAFMAEWLSLYDSKSGERGIFNREAAMNLIPERRKKLGYEDFLCNPCCVTGDTNVLTSTGHFPIQDLVGKEVEVWTGESWEPVVPYAMGEWPIYEVRLSDGTSLKCTENHRFVLEGRGFVETKHLSYGDKLAKFSMPVVREGVSYLGDAYSQGFYSGDGNTNLDHSWLYEPKFMCEERLTGTFGSVHSSVARKTWKHGTMRAKDFVPVDSDLSYVMDWLSGLLDADGTVLEYENGSSLQIGATDLEFLRKVRLMLTRLGVQAKIGLMHGERRHPMPDGRGGLASYDCQAVHRLLINTVDTEQLVRLGLRTERLKLNKLSSQRDARRFVTVSDVVDLGYSAPTFCFTEPKTSRGTFNGIVTGQSEILLRSAQTCNLSEVVIRPEDTLVDLVEKAKYAAILGTMQATLTDFRYVSKRWKENCEAERLLGVSLTGVMDHPVMNGSEGQGKLVDWLWTLKEVIIKTNEEWARRLGITPATATSCVKPSGCRPSNALVTTDDGIFELGELDYSGGQWTDVSLTGGEYGRITKTFINGEAEIMDITLSFGMKLSATPNHRWMVNKRGWVRTDELRAGDQLVINLNSYQGTVDANLIKPDLSDLYCNVNLGVTLPDKMSPDFAWLLGYLWGDGAMCQDKARFRIVDGGLDAIEKAKRLFFELFGLDGNVRQLNDREAYSLEIGSRVLWGLFEANGLIKPRTEDLKNIPLVVRRSSVETVCAFLSGLIDSDGCVCRCGPIDRVSITTSREEFARHLQHVLLSIGQVYGLSVQTKKTGAYENSGPTVFLSLCWGQSSDNKWLVQKHSVKMSEFIPPETNNRSSIYKIGVVKEVTPSGKVPTFDVETEQHWFWAGAFMSHNTVSQLVDAASGIHPRYAPYYIRTVRADKKDPLAQLMVDAGVPHESDVMRPDSTWVFSFPVKAPKHAVFRDDRSAIEQLELWKTYQLHFTEHKPSITVYVKEQEWPEVGAWVWDNFDIVSGVSFLPHTEHTYAQAPYQECDEETYLKALAAFPDLDWDLLSKYELEDRTEGMREFACTGNSCEVL